MKVHLSFDVEVWCNGWERLDEEFPAAFDRYILGRSPQGDWGLPQTLAILRRHGLCGVFFVEPLFAARFGEQHLRRVVELIAGGRQDVQLHIHPEWVDEIRPPLIPDSHRKRQHLSYYTLEEQTTLLGHGKRLLEQALGGTVTAFRAGSYAANHDTYEALARSGILVDSSLNTVYDFSGTGLPPVAELHSHRRIGRVTSYPISVFLDGTGRPRPAQLGACSFAEMRQALDRAECLGFGHAVIVSHSFELLKDRRSVPDPIMVRRFEQLCAYLAAHPERFQVEPFPLQGEPESRLARPAATLGATLVRHAEQALRRLW